MLLKTLAPRLINGQSMWTKTLQHKKYKLLTDIWNKCFVIPSNQINMNEIIIKWYIFTQASFMIGEDIKLYNIKKTNLAIYVNVFTYIFLSW